MRKAFYSCYSLTRTVDWDKYALYRPKYSNSLEKLIIDHHCAHSNSFRLAYNVGSGSGVFAVRLE